MELAKRLLVQEHGQGMVEYALLIALIAVAVMGTVKAVGAAINGEFEAVQTELNNTP